VCGQAYDKRVRKEKRRVTYYLARMFDERRRKEKNDIENEEIQSTLD
jgi:hypothetical protein